MVKLPANLAKFVVPVMVALALASCNSNINSVRGSGHVTKIDRTLGDFTAIEAGNGLEIIIEQSDAKSVTVEADDNIQPHILTRVENGVLKISSDKNQFVNATRKVHVKLPVITSLSADSGVDMRSANTLIANDITVDSESGSSVRIDLEADEVISESSSGSQMTLRGKALTLNISGSSGSSNDAARLLSNDVHAQASSGSSVRVHPLLSLDAKASSGGSVEYYNVPKTFVKKVSSGGSVSQQ